MPLDAGKRKFLFCQRLGESWRDLALCLNIPANESNRFVKGDEGREILNWLEHHNRLDDLPEALVFIGREDLALLWNPPPAPSPTAQQWQGCPFPGLRPFSAEYTPVFFGRNRYTDELVARLTHTEHRFIAVVGASGSGKSSLVAAGLLPRLLHGAVPGSRDWIVLELTPGGPGEKPNPFHGLSFQLEPLLKQHGWRARDLYNKLRASGGLPELAEQALEPLHHSAELLVFIDQFEELFTLCDERHRLPFINMLAQAAATPRLRIVMTMRSDFTAQCLQYGRLAELLKAGFYPLPPPSIAELYDMITRPAAAAGLTFAPEDLPLRILDDTGTEPGALALMAFALSELYEARQPDGMLRLDAYERFGGVKGVLGRRADATYAQLDAPARAALGSVFKELVEVEPERGVPTRKRAPLRHFSDSPAALQLIEAFTQARLLVCSSPENAVEVVEVAHEALLTHWQLLRQWIEARFDDFRLLRQVKLAAAEWKQQKRAPAYLWPHERLAPVKQMLDNLQPKLSRAEWAFVRLESQRLLKQINRPATSHQQRAKIGDRLAEIGDPRPGVGLNDDGLPDIVWCPVPAGEITLEENAGTFDVAPFAISKYPVTWAQYRCFLQADDGYRRIRWWKGLAQREKTPGEQYRQLDNHPAENVSWYDAVAYCRWLSARLGYEVRLPAEWEWQQAATGGDPANAYPWGADWDAERANTFECGLSRTTAVGMYPRGAASVGALDMSGNVEEWCLNAYEDAKRIDISGDARRVGRGGSWNNNRNNARVSYRNHNDPGTRNNNLGLRVVRSSHIVLPLSTTQPGQCCLAWLLRALPPALLAREQLPALAKAKLRTRRVDAVR
jgi:formylglycine-generating enzyme required for sulfatase activity